MLQPKRGFEADNSKVEEVEDGSGSGSDSDDCDRNEYAIRVAGPNLGGKRKIAAAVLISLAMPIAYMGISRFQTSGQPSAALPFSISDSVSLVASPPKLTVVPLPAMPTRTPPPVHSAELSRPRPYPLPSRPPPCLSPLSPPSPVLSSPSHPPPPPHPRAPPPSCASPPPSPPPWIRSWSQHEGLNCYTGFGATVAASDVRGISTIDACKASCLNEPSCEGIVFGQEPVCYRRKQIVPTQCARNDGQWSTFTLDPMPPSAPSPPQYPRPPAPPPAPPSLPRIDPIKRINERFRNSRYTSTLEEAGVLLHQFDELEVRGQPWKACVGNCYCQGVSLLGRISAMLIYHQMQDRSDRLAIPLPFADRAGYIINPHVVELECLYGVDGSTAFVRKTGVEPGCPASFCNANNPALGVGQGRCGFDGWPIGAWRGSDLAQFMPMHQQHGSQYKAPGFHSGYNEVVLNSGKLNAQLPHTIEAWFVVDEAFAHGDGVGVNAVRAHQDFLHAYGLSADEVPLLKLSPGTWDEPFSLLQLS